MRLLTYANRNLSLLLFFLIGIWGVFFYLTIIDEVIDETDDRLDNTRDIIIGKALLHPALLTATDSIMQTYSIRPLTEEQAREYEERFFDSTIYIQSEDEWEPVRVMKSCFRAANGEFYELEISMSTLERDDMIEAIFTYLLILYLALLVSTIIGNHLILRKTFKPLQRLLVWLDSLTPGKPIPPLRNETDIKEFKKLNKAAYSWAIRSERAYEEQKSFIENASHELQTPLAISIGKLELLAEGEALTEQQMNTIDELYQNLNRVVKLNKSLLLISRISNGQYPETKEININQMIDQIIADLMEVYEEKNIRPAIRSTAICTVRMNEHLAHILFTNLLKNAIVHNHRGGRLSVVINKDTILICNSGEKPLDTTRLYQRFYRADNANQYESNGLGLSIVKSIADIYHIKVEYTYEEEHVFCLNFVK